MLHLQARQPHLSSALQQLLKNFSLSPDGWLSLILGPLTTWSLTNHVCQLHINLLSFSPNGQQPLCSCAWSRTAIFALNGKRVWFVTSSPSRAWQFCSTASTPISPSVVVASLALASQGSWCISPPLSFLLTQQLIVISPLILLAGLLLWLPSTMSNHIALQL